MAIQFARCEYVSRSSGGNAYRKASYNQRETVRCDRTGELFSFKERGGNVHHEVLLPVGVHEKFKNSSTLWNEVEGCEKWSNSQLAKEFVLALPDDKEVSLEDRIELTRRFAHLFIEKGVAVQLDVHSPHEGEKNWHAHLLVTTRRFSEDGLTFAAKARDLDPVIRGGVVVEANLWGEAWRDIQNAYFEEKGYDLRVDPIGIIPQEHLGPVRMRHHLNEAIVRSQMLQKANETLAQNPDAVLEEITKTRAVFSKKEVELFLQKHVPTDERNGRLEQILENHQVIPLYDKERGKETPYFTTKAVRAEEEKLIRFADKIAHKPVLQLSPGSIAKGLENKTLSPEQKEAYDLCTTSGQNLAVIQGRAGVGKSYVLGAIRETHEASGYRVLGLAPTNKVAQDLNRDGFQEAQTCHSFLFRFKNGREKLDSNTLVIVDEAAMLGTTSSVELFNVIKNNGAKLILVGDDRQLSSVERGETFKFLAERYESAELQNVRRQTIDWQKAVSEDLSKSEIKSAVQLLQENKAISWNSTKEEALAELLKTWAQDNLLNPHKTRLILAQKNVDVNALNQGARDVLRARGQLGEIEILCSTQRGRVAFAEGDRVQFTTTDKSQGLINGSFGVIERIDPQTKNMNIRLDSDEIKQVNPNTYDGLRHGYASTVYKAQGGTLDDVYVLHGKTTNKSTNYVALTRQTRSLHLYVSQEETPTHAALIHQMGRQDGNGTSLFFDTQQDIERRQEEKSWGAQLKHSAEAFVTKAKDLFHSNENFYRFEKPKGFSQEKAEFVLHPVQKDPASPLPKNAEAQKQELSFAELVTRCETRLLKLLEKANKPLTPERTERVALQAERTASFIYHAHPLKGNMPTEKEMTQFSLRAKYELDRIPEIRKELMEEWKDKGTLNSHSGMRAHRIAERLASIEGRLFLQAKQKGLEPSSSIATVARQGFKHHRSQTSQLAEELSQKYALSKKATTFCAQNILRYKETHGEKPSDTQISRMIQISKDLEKKDYSKIAKSQDSQVIELLRRKEGNLLFQHTSSHKKSPTADELSYIQTQAKKAVNSLTLQITQEIARTHQKEFSI